MRTSEERDSTESKLQPKTILIDKLREVGSLSAISIMHASYILPPIHLGSKKMKEGNEKHKMKNVPDNACADPDTVFPGLERTEGQSPAHERA